MKPLSVGTSVTKWGSMTLRVTPTSTGYVATLAVGNTVAFTAQAQNLLRAKREILRQAKDVLDMIENALSLRDALGQAAKQLASALPEFGLEYKENAMWALNALGIEQDLRDIDKLVG